MEKIFCIGFMKTGTTSVGRALQNFGFRHAKYSRWIHGQYKMGNVERVIRYASKYDSFDDLPWSKVEIVPLLDKAFPGSKFIDTSRDVESWMSSVVSWNQKMRGAGVDADQKLSEYKRHMRFCEEYFVDRPSDYIKVDVSCVRSYEQLCEFLNVDPVGKSFPHANRTDDIREWKA